MTLTQSALTLAGAQSALTLTGAPPGQLVDEGMRGLAVGLLRGVYLGLLTGVIPATIAWALGFLFRYVTNVSIPAFGVVVLAVALAGANGGLLAVVDPAIQSSADAPTLVTALLVVMMLALFAHGRGDALGAALPRRFGLDRLGAATLSRDVVAFVGSRGQVTVRVVGAVGDVPGSPALPADLRAEIAGWEATLPADLPLAELESRVADRLRTTFDLADVRVSVDETAAATVAAAPPAAGVSRRVPTGRRAPSVATLLPTGLARGDEVTVHVAGDQIRGTVVSAGAYPGGVPFGSGGAGAVTTGAVSSPPAGTPATPSSASGSSPSGVSPVPSASPAPSAPSASPTTGTGTATGTGTGTESATRQTATTVGGPGRLTVAVGGDDTERLLAVDTADTVVRPRGDSREYELLGELRRAGLRLRRLSVRPDSPLAGATVGALASDATTPAVVLAVRGDGDWAFAPADDRALAAGDDVFLLATRQALATVGRGPA